MNRSSIRTRVVKLGGSLLTRRDIDRGLALWLESTAADGRAAVIVGGGELIDVMRAIDQRWPLDSVAMHWRCVELLRFTMEIVAERLPHLKVIRHATELAAWQHATQTIENALIDVAAFYQPNDPVSQQLPSSWQTTTDSIAALLARKLQADTLTLLKSRSLPAGIDWSAAAHAGIVDDAFPQAIEGLADVRIVDFANFCEHNLAS